MPIPQVGIVSAVCQPCHYQTEDRAGGYIPDVMSVVFAARYGDHEGAEEGCDSKEKCR